jgi:hypothetical protein
VSRITKNIKLNKKDGKTIHPLGPSSTGSPIIISIINNI